MSIVIGCDSFLALRNLRLSGLSRELRDSELHVWVDPSQLHGAKSVADPNWEVDALVPFNPHEHPALREVIVRSHATRKAFRVPRSTWPRYVHRASVLGDGNRLQTSCFLLSKLKEFGIHWVRGFLAHDASLRCRVEEALRQTEVAKRYIDRLRRVGAKVVLSLSPEGPREMALMAAASAVGIPTIVAIRSRDNLVAKIEHLPQADAFFVWSDLMKRHLRQIYPEIPERSIHVTGAPQFQHHFREDLRPSRKQFFQSVGLDPGRRLIVYSCATPNLIPHEIAIIQRLIGEFVDEGRLAGKAQLLIRQHPRGFGSDALGLGCLPAGVVVYSPGDRWAYRSLEHEADVVRQIALDEPMHLGTIAYQDVQVNVSGTMSVDAIILDKPVINVYFDEPAHVPRGLSVRRFYRRLDSREVVDSGAVRLARTCGECVELIERFLAEPGLDAANRARFRELACGPLDGRVGSRWADVVRRLRRVPIRPTAGKEGRDGDAKLHLGGYS